MSTLMYLSLLLIMLAFILCLTRIIIGPELADRVIAYDLLTNILIAFIVIYARTSHQSVYLDIVIVIALVMFLSGTMFARYIGAESTNTRGDE